MERPYRSTVNYRIVRETYLNPQASRKDLKEEINDVEESLRATMNKEIITETNGDLVLNRDKLVEVWADLWNKEIGMEMDPKGRKKTLIENYVEEYLTEVSESTLEEMLVKDFFQGIRSYCEKEVDKDWLQMWFLTLKQNYESMENPEKIVEDALKDI